MGFINHLITGGPHIVYMWYNMIPLDIYLYIYICIYIYNGYKMVIYIYDGYNYIHRIDRHISNGKSIWCICMWIFTYIIIYIYINIWIDIETCFHNNGC